MWVKHSRVTLSLKLTGDVDVKLIVPYPGLNLNLAQTAPAHEKKQTVANPGV